MAKDVRLLIKGSAQKAEAAIKELQRTGQQATSMLERDFKQLGMSSNLVFDNKRKSANDAYQKIKQSGVATRDELKRAQKAHAAKLVEIDKSQYGQRSGLMEKFKVKQVAAYGAIGVAAAGFAAVRIADAALDQYQEYETALTDMAKVTDENLDQINDKIMDMPAALGSATSLMEGYYQTISAGVTEPKEAMDMLTVASKASKAGHVEQADTIRALTKLMAGFSGEIKTAGEASDLLFAIEKAGQTSFAELVPVIGDISSLSKQAGVNQGEMGAMMARMTQTAGSTSQAATQYKAVLMGLLKPQKTMTDTLAEMGFESGIAAVEQLGLSGALQALSNQAGESNTSMSKLFESSEALTGLGPLLAGEFKEYEKTLIDMENSVGGTENAFEDWQNTMDATEEIFDNTINKIMIELGRELAPQVNQSMRGFSDWVTEHKDEINSFFQGLGAVLEGVADAAGFVYEGISQIAEGAAGLSIWTENAIDTAGNVVSGAIDSVFGGSDSGPAPGNTNINAPFGSFSPSFAIGTSYVPRTGLYQLHRGEQVSTRTETQKKQPEQQSISIGDVNLNLPNVTNQATARQLAKDLLPELSSLMRSRLRTAY
jgi:TP901 family phage tail tape measure protein